MELIKDEARFYFPEASMKNTVGKNSLERVTHLAIGAHQDDLEVMAAHGIVNCYKKNDLWFGGVTVTNGSGSARIGKFANLSDEEMSKVRHDEQEVAADQGEYSFVAQLAYSSSEIKSGINSDLVTDLAEIISACKPKYIYTHNLFDKHRTHTAVVVSVLEALKRVDFGELPEKIYGCEVWRDLDWLPDDEKVAFDLTGHEKFISSLIQVFESQIEGGKRYDLATLGRMRANATYFQSHETDKHESLCFALDLTSLLKGDEYKTLDEYAKYYLDKFSKSVLENIKF